MVKKRGRSEKVQFFIHQLVLIAVTLLLIIGCAKKKKKIVIWSSMRPVERAQLDTLLNEVSTGYPHYEFNQLFYAPEERHDDIRKAFNIIHAFGYHYKCSKCNKTKVNYK